MNQRIVAILILVAGCVMSSELDPGDDDLPHGPVDLSDDIKQELADLSGEERQKVAEAISVFWGVTQLIRGHEDEEIARLVAQNFLEDDDTEWWRCDDAGRYIMDDGCGADGCPVTLAANRTMALGNVMFAGSESYAHYAVEGLEREWNWCVQDDDNFRCAFVLSAGGDGVYYDFNAASTTIRSDGREIAQPAGRFKCEQFTPPEKRKPN